MSKIEIKPFEEQIRIAGIAGELERAEERGYENGLKEGLKEGLEKERKKIISKLLKKNTPEEVSKMTEIPLKDIQRIKDEINAAH